MISSSCDLPGQGRHIAGQELVALLGFLVFLNGDEVHGTDLIQPLLQRLDLQLNGRPVGSTPPAAISSAASASAPSSQALIRHRDGDAPAPDVVEVHMIFLLDPFPEILDGHVFLRQFDIERTCASPARSELICRLSFAQRFPSRAVTSFSCDCFCSSNPAVPALTCSRSCCSRCSICRRESLHFRLACSLRAMNDDTSPRRCSQDLCQFMNALAEDCCLLPERGQHLFLRCERHLAFGQGGVC